jgi:excinuclease ABC subunit B
VPDRDGYGGADVAALAPEQAVKRIKKLEAEMTKLARNLEFEQAAKLRDEIQKLRHLAFGAPLSRAG